MNQDVSKTSDWQVFETNDFMSNRANATVRSIIQQLRNNKMKETMKEDNVYFNVLHGKINFQFEPKEYIDLLQTRANSTVRPTTLKMRMKQMKEKMNEEINLSRTRYENCIQKQNSDSYSNNIFFLYKKRKHIFNNNKSAFQSEEKNVQTQRNQTNYSPKRKTQFNQTMIDSPNQKDRKIKQQQYQEYLKINQQIQKQKGQLNEQILKLLEQKVYALNLFSVIAKSLKQSCTKFGVNSYLQALKTIQVLKYKIAINENITHNVIRRCDNFLENKNVDLFVSQQTYTLYLRFMEEMQEMDDQISQYMLNYELKNGMKDKNSILEDINQMRDDAYNEKVRTFSKYHDIDQEKKRDRQKLNKIKVYF